MKIRFKKLVPHAVTPTYAHGGDACVDLTAIARSHDESGSIITYNTGLAFEIPEGYVGLLFPRSSIYKSAMSLSNSVGVIDSGFIGEILFKFRSHGHGIHLVYNVGDRVGQLMIVPIPKIEYEEVLGELSDTSRGTGGFGSTGD